MLPEEAQPTSPLLDSPPGFTWRVARLREERNRFLT
jgi:hypothetical protein